jgi:flagellar hook-associated protein 2
MTGVSLSGLGSGLDINTIVTQLMAIERRPQQLMERRKVTFETAGTAIDGIRTKMQDLRFAASDIGSVAGWNNVAAKSSDETRAKVTSIAGGSSTGSIRFAIETLAGSRTLATTTNFAAGATVASGSIDLTVKGTTHNISVGGGTIEEVAAAINDANVGASASLVQVTPGNFKLQINAESGAASNDLAVSGVSGGGWITVSTGFDARIRVGGSGGSGGYTVTSSDNFFDNVLPGTKIEAIRSAATTYVRVTTEPDSSKVADNVQKMVDKLNELAKDINEKTKIDPQANTRGPLAGNAAVRPDRDLRRRARRRRDQRRRVRHLDRPRRHLHLRSGEVHRGLRGRSDCDQAGVHRSHEWHRCPHRCCGAEHARPRRRDPDLGS